MLKMFHVKQLRTVKQMNEYINKKELLKSLINELEVNQLKPDSAMYLIIHEILKYIDDFPSKKIDDSALINAIQEDYNSRMQEMYKEEIFKGYYSKVYCDGIDAEFKSVVNIIKNMLNIKVGDDSD